MVALGYAVLADVKTRCFDDPTDTTYDGLLGGIIEQVNAGIESFCGRSIGPDPQTVYLLDGFDSMEAGRVMYFSGGIQSISLLEIAPYTGQPYQTIPATDYFLMPRAQDRNPGWPAFEIQMTDIPTGGNPFPFFMPGYATGRMTGVFGWAAIPPELIEVAEITCVRAFQARQSGQGDTVGNDETGTAIVTAYLSSWHLKTLKRYRWNSGEVI